jgi:anti-sigma factor RsiW
MNCEGYNDIVAADVDAMLASGEAQEAEAHVASCSRCQATRRKQQFAKSMLRERLVRQSAPEDLRRRVLTAIEGEPRISAVPPTSLRPRTSRRRIMAGAIAALLAVGLYSVLSPAKPDIIGVMVADAEAADSGRLDLAMRTSNVEELQTYYQESGQIDFRQSVGDFSGQGFHLVGGSVEYIGSQSTTRSLYDSSDGKVVCRRFRIGSVDIPVIGEQAGSRHVFTVDGVTFGIVRLEGDVVCILATKMPREAFVRHLEQTHTEVSEFGADPSAFSLRDHSQPSS